MTLTDIRHDLHNHPGLSGDEHYAHDLVVGQLAHCHPDKLFPHVGGYGVIAVWGTHPSRPTIAIRGDMDALPIGHRCGHDGHTTILLQLAIQISQQGIPDDRNVLLIFQPEEETGLGAQKIIDAQILQQYNIKAIYALHNLPGFPLGTVVLNRHTFAAASTGIIYRLIGRETHASTPEKGINPGLAVADIIQRLNRYNSSPSSIDDTFRQATLICVRLGEEAFGTSAGSAEVMFTLRAFTNDTMEHFISDAHATVAQTAVLHHLEMQHTLIEPFRATENNALYVEHIEEVCGCRSQYVLSPFRWSEDFANYLLHYPGAMFGIGAGVHQPELHHPDYDFPDELIPLAAQVFYNIVSDAKVACVQ